MDINMKEGLLTTVEKDLLYSEIVHRGKEVWTIGMSEADLILAQDDKLLKHDWESVLGAKLTSSKKKSKRLISIITYSIEGSSRNLSTIDIHSDDPEKLVKIIQSMSFQRKMPDIYDTCFRKRLKIIINPNSGRGLARRVWSSVSAMFEACETSISFTERRNHATEIVSELNLSDFDTLVVVSGDGLVHEVINALCKREDGDFARLFPVSVVPAGSANALAQVICDRSGENVTPETSAFICIKGKPRPYDLSLVRFESGLNVFSFLCVFWAFIADVDIESEKCRCCGSCRFDVYGFWRVLALRRYAGSITWEEGEYQGPIVYFMACNAPFIGQGMNVAPRSKVDDGFNDIMFLGNEGRMTLARVLLRQDAGTHVNVPQLQYVKAAKWALKPEGKRGIFSIDGELFQCDNIEVDVLKEYATVVFL
jgi:YegS/Rv2252/BmrU family lipid kinase